MRHGHSLANLESIIVSHPENGVGSYGLSSLGKEQVTEAGKSVGSPGQNITIVSSDFKRARETAEIMHRLLNCDAPIRFDERLRERNFGDLELADDSAYARVWLEDAINPDNNLNGVEGPNQVMQRVTTLVAEYEEKMSGLTLLLISHGDALQILQTAFSGQAASQHRQQPHLETAEIRRLNLSRSDKPQA